MITEQVALEKMFNTFFENLDKLPTMLKIMCILHRALQDDEISKWVAKSLKQNEHLIYSCTKDNNSSEGKFCKWPYVFSF